MVETRELFEMNIPRDAAIMRIANLEEQINSHLIKLLAFQADDGVRTHWKRELRAWFRRIAAYRLKGKGRSADRPPSAKLYYDHLYEHIFGGHEVQNTTSIINLLIEDEGYTRNNRPIDDVVPRLRTFHQTIAQRMAMAQSFDDLLASL